MKNNQISQRESNESKKSKESQYETAREALLAKVVPDEEENAPTCLWKLCCCFYYLFCCCFCEQSKQVTQHIFRQRFGRWLNLEILTRGRDKKKMSVIKNLMRLYAHQSEALIELQKCRVNPDFNSPFRDDLEFFIPQLCSFYLKGEFENPADISNIMVLASSTSFFFSHRVWFFFQSTMYQDFDEEIYKKSRLILKAQKGVCLENKEKMYLANSRDLINLIVQLNLTDFWPSLKFDKKLINYQKKLTMNNHNNNYQLASEIEKDQQLEKLLQVQNIIKNYINGNDESQTDSQHFDSMRFKKISAVSIDDQGNEITLCAKDIILQPFIFTLDHYDDHNLHLNNHEMNEDKRQKLQAFLSTPKFIKCLTDISNNLSQAKMSKEEKVKILKEELTKINQNLPASVYIPFVNNSIRNYAVLHIDINECRIFQTKERAPFMVAVELYRPDELNLYQTKNAKGNSNNNEDSEGSLSFEDSDNADEENPYIRDKKIKEQQLKEKKSKFAFNKLPTIRNRSNSQKKSSRKGIGQIIRQSTRKNSDFMEQEEISKFADLRVSNALIINKVREKDQIIKKVMDDSDVEGRKKVKPRAQKSSIQEESPDMSFEHENQHAIEMTYQTPTIQGGQGSQQLQTERKVNLKPLISAKKEEENFEDFYSNYRTYSADSSNLKQYSDQLNKTRQEKDAQTVLPSTGQSAIIPIRIPDEEDPNNLFADFLQKQNPSESNNTLFHSIQNQYQINEDDRVINLPDSDDSSSDDDEEDSSSSGEEIEEEKQSTPQSNENRDNYDLYGENHIKNALMNHDSEGTSREKKKSHKKKNILIKETSKEQEDRLRKNSPFGSLKSWKIFRFIVKSNDDVRQEQFAMQLISEIQQIFKLKKLPLWLKTYEILATGPNCGLIDYINDAMSLDEIHKKTDNQSLYDFYVSSYGNGKKRSKGFKRAQKAFCYSLAAYSLVTYILQVKDRHNQNIMIDNEGHIIHIDYGFLLSNAPGKGLKFEKAPFKLTQEFVNVLRGTKNKKFILYRNLMKLGFMALQEHADKVIILVEMMMMGAKDLPCFQDGENTVKTLKERFFPTGRKMNETEASKFIDILITQSYGNWRTIVYDKIQYCCQGIV